MPTAWDCDWSGGYVGRPFSQLDAEEEARQQGLTLEQLYAKKRGEMQADNEQAKAAELERLRKEKGAIEQRISSLEGLNPDRPLAPGRALAALRPGSDEAIQAGCNCPVLDNAHGAGYLGLGKVWVMRTDCKIHGQTAAAPPNARGDDRATAPGSVKPAVSAPECSHHWVPVVDYSKRTGGLHAMRCLRCLAWKRDGRLAESPNKEVRNGGPDCQTETAG